MSPQDFSLHPTCFCYYPKCFRIVHHLVSKLHVHVIYSRLLYSDLHRLRFSWWLFSFLACKKGLMCFSDTRHWGIFSSYGWWIIQVKKVIMSLLIIPRLSADLILVHLVLANCSLSFCLQFVLMLDNFGLKLIMIRHCYSINTIMYLKLCHAHCQTP